MMHRVIVVIFCSGLSCLGLLVPLAVLWEALTCITIGTCQLEISANTLFFIVTMLLVGAVWLFYFFICIRWINDRAINMKIRVLGVFLCGSCILITAGQTLLVTLPSACLILYIHFTMPYRNQSVKKERVDD